MQARVHLGLVAIAAVLAVLAPPATALRIDGLAPALNVLLAVAVIAGPAAFVLAGTTPLVSSWAAADDPARRAPWWLYAVSNAASFAGLLAYPLLLEPLLPLSVQRALVVAGLIAYGVAIALLLRASRAAAAAAPDDAPAAPAPTTAPEATDGTQVPAGTRLRPDARLVLELAEGSGVFAGESITRRLDRLAQAMGLEATTTLAA